MPREQARATRRFDRGARADRHGAVVTGGESAHGDGEPARARRREGTHANIRVAGNLRAAHGTIWSPATRTATSYGGGDLRATVAPAFYGERRGTSMSRRSACSPLQRGNKRRGWRRRVAAARLLGGDSAGGGEDTDGGGDCGHHPPIPSAPR